MKKKHVLIPLLLALLILVSCGGKEIYKDHPAMGKWNGHEASALGMSVPLTSVFSEVPVLELQANGKCALQLDGENYTGKFTLEGNTLTIKQGKDELKATVTDTTITFDDISGVQLVFLKEGASKTAPDSGTEKKDNDKEEAAKEQKENKLPEGLNPDPDMKEVERNWYKDWYGYGKFTNGYENDEKLDDDFQDCYAYIEEDKTGRPFFEAYIPEYNEENPIFSMYIRLDEEQFVEDDEDAFFLDANVHGDKSFKIKGIKDKDGHYIIKIKGRYQSPDEKGTHMDYEFLLRPYGLQWDKKEFELPPGYQDYLKEIGPQQ